MPTKSELRAEMKRLLRAMPETACRVASERLRESLRSEIEAAGGGWIGLFAALPGEPNIVSHPWEQGTLCFPRVTPSGLVFHAVDSPGDLYSGAFGVLEPLPESPTIPLARISVLAVPGLAFTQTGGRLGRGAGFYDRLLADPARPRRVVGVCFAVQILPELPQDPWDRQVDAVLSA